MSNKIPRKKILIVEDQPDMCLILDIILAGNEIELQHVKNIQDAQKYLEDNHPDMVILDNQLPDGMGVDFIVLLKEKYPGVKVVMISAFGDEIKQEAIYRGADEYLTKPFTRSQLLEVVHGLMTA